MKGPKSILLVDDDETTNFLNQFFLKQVDPDVAVNLARNGAEAIDFLKNSIPEDIAPCLLILDTHMPTMDGWGFLEAFGEEFDEDFRNKVVIVMLTALDTAAAVDKAMADPNVTDTAQKPLSDLKFRVLINKYFS